MANPATIDDVEARWGSLTGNEAVKVQALLDYAWAIVVSSVATVDDRLDDETLPRALVVGVVVTAVVRAIENPHGYRQETQTVGNSTLSFTRADSGTGRSFFEPGELDLLAAAGSPKAAFTIRPYGEPQSGSTEPQLWF